MIRKTGIYNFHGCYSKDNLPKILDYGFYIVNAQSEHDGNGTHWCAFWYNQPLNSICFDPFGFIANKDTQDKIMPYIFNDKDLATRYNFNIMWILLYCI